MNIELRLKQIEDRKVEIRKALEGNDENLKLDDIKIELEKLDNEERSLKEKIEILNGLNNGIIEGRKIENPADNITQKRDISSMTMEELLSSKEYRSAYLKRLQGKQLTDIEQRALTTATNSAAGAVPTTTLNMIIDKLRQTSALFDRINVSYMPGNLSLVISNAKNAASWKAEGSDGTPQDDTVTALNLSGYELIKLVEISAAADAMTIDAFETYIASEIGRQLSIAIENAIVNGTGNGQPTGILSGVTWDATNSTTWTTSVDYDNLMDALTLLPTMYHNNATFVMNRKMLFGGVRKIKDAQKNPIFAYNPQDKAAMTILGYPIILDDYVPDDTIILGDMSYYYMNFSKTPEISSDRSAGFKSGKIVYRGLAVVDGKPALNEAFVKISKAEV
jgi:HK97 family phage major capsid protein